MGKKLGKSFLIPLFMLAGYCLLPLWFPLIPHYQQDVTDLRGFAPSLLSGLAYAGLLMTLFGLNWLAAHRVAFSPRLILLLSCLYGLPLLFVYPINANDVFGYFLQGRITLSGASPYAVSPAEVETEYAALAGEWADSVSPYGPVWTGVEAFLSWTTNGDLLRTLVGFKLVGLLSVLGVGWLIFELTRLATQREDGARRNAILWLWNPAVLFMLVIDAHNDGVVLFWLLLGLWVWKKHDLPLLATMIMLLAPLTKLSGIVPVPFFAVAILRSLPNLSARLRYVGLSIVGAIILIFLTFLPFGSPRDLFVRLLSESQAGGGFSPLAFVHFIGETVPGIELSIGEWVAWGTPLFVIISGLLLIGVFLGQSASQKSAESYYVYLITAFKFRIWYALWPFPFALISGSPYHRRAAYLLLVTSQLSVILYGHVRIYLFNGNHAVAHLVGVPFTFLLPLILPFLIKTPKMTPSKPT